MRTVKSSREKTKPVDADTGCALSETCHQQFDEA